MKIRVFLTFLLVLLLACTHSFAAQMDNEANPGTVLAVEGGAINFNFSPGVAGAYITEGTTDNEQWYALSTYHNGGNSFFASTSDSTSIYKQSRDAAEVFGDVELPTSPLANVIQAADPTATPPVPEILGTADEYFLDNGWAK